MAKKLVTNFKSIRKSFVGGDGDANVFEDITSYVPDLETHMILGLDICNKIDTGVTVDIRIADNSSGTKVAWYLCKNVPVPAGATLPVIIHQKHVLESHMKLEVRSSTDASVDITGSYMNTYVESF